MIKRLLDLLICFSLLLVLAVPLLVIALLVKATSPGSVLYWSRRVGKENVIFPMPKFRTMFTGTPEVATHLLRNADLCFTPLGSFLRKYSIDELPQLLSVIKGDMSLVGPRPALYNQDDLIALRTARNIHHLLPGVTGWAQIHGRDEVSIPEKVAFDEYYFCHRSLLMDVNILWCTVFKVVKKEGVAH
ncbi:MAG: sugar transferase [Smithellaceae bacterium]